jgi:hypothetical protein
MPRTRYEKSPELIEAYLGDYSATQRDVVRRGAQIVHLLEGGSKTIADREVQQYVRPGIGTEEALRFSQGYGPHIRRQLDTLDGRQFLESKAEAITRYNTTFRDRIHDMLSLSDGPHRESRAADVYPLFIDTEKYAVRVVNGGHIGTPITEVNKHIDAGLRVKGIPHMEHIAAVSYKDAVTVSPYVRGVSLRDMASTEELRAIRPEQVRELYTAAKLAESRGVRFDGAASNLRYHPDDGFTFIDLEIDAGTGQRTELALLSIIDYLRIYGPPENDELAYLLELRYLMEHIIACMDAAGVASAVKGQYMQHLSRLRRSILLRGGDA